MVIEDIMKGAFDRMLTDGIEAVYYTGTEAMVSKKLTDMPVDERYPLVAVVTPIYETTNSSGYVEIRLPRVVIGTKTVTTNTPSVRLEQVFKLILIPVYEAYFKALSKQAGIIERDWRLWLKEKYNQYGEMPATDKVADVLDSIEVRNTIFRINQNLC